MINGAFAGRMTAVLGLVATVVVSGVVSAPPASAQSGSRLCGRLVAGSGSAHSLYLVEVDKDSEGWGEFDKDYQACENAQQRWVDSRTCKYAKCYEYTTCEEVSGAIGWSRYTGRPDGYNPNDICTSMRRSTGYKLGLTGDINGVLNVNSFAAG